MGIFPATSRDDLWGSPRFGTPALPPKLEVWGVTLTSRPATPETPGGRQMDIQMPLNVAPDPRLLVVLLELLVLGVT